MRGAAVADAVSLWDLSWQQAHERGQTRVESMFSGVGQTVCGSPVWKRHELTAECDVFVSHFQWCLIWKTACTNYICSNYVSTPPALSFVSICGELVFSVTHSVECFVRPIVFRGALTERPLPRASPCTTSCVFSLFSALCWNVFGLSLSHAEYRVRPCLCTADWNRHNVCLQ